MVELIKIYESKKAIRVKYENFYMNLYLRKGFVEINSNGEPVVIGRLLNRAIAKIIYERRKWKNNQLPLSFDEMEPYL